MVSIDPAFKIYVDQLRAGKVEVLDAEVSPEFLDVEEKELSFSEPVALKGEAYLAQDELIVKVSATTHAQMPCRICNESCDVEVSIKNHLQVFPVGGLKRGYIDLREMLREALLLELPLTSECRGGCSVRGEIGDYLREELEGGDDSETGFHPFADLDLGDR